MESKVHQSADFKGKQLEEDIDLHVKGFKCVYDEMCWWRSKSFFPVGKDGF